MKYNPNEVQPVVIQGLRKSLEQLSTPFDPALL